MSIPHYQEVSLQGENVAKRRVIKKAKEAFEGEEQRAIKSGQVVDDIKTSYKTILQNLQLQLITMNLTKSTVESIIAAVFSGQPKFRMSTILATPVSDEEQSMSEEGSDFEVAQGNLHSLLIGSLGKLVSLSSQLRLMCDGLSDKVKESGKPVTGSADLSKINSLFAEVKRAFGFYDETGFNKGLQQMLDDLRAVGGRGVPAVERLVELYGANMSESEKIVGRIQRNEYETNIESVFIPSRNQRPDRQAGRADGSERQVWNREEYKLLLQLRDEGLLRGDDFISVYEGNRGDDSTVASSRSSRSSSSANSRNPFGDFRYVARRRMSRRGYEKDDDSRSSVYSDDDGTIASLSDDSGMYPVYREPDSDDESDYSGAGLYSLPPSYRFPQRSF